jgi:transglutaminase-like putative cysteine protease
MSVTSRELIRSGLGVVALIVIPCFGLQAWNPPPSVGEAIDLAGDNAGELHKTVYHFLGGRDSLKLEAAYFLIANMEDHCYVTYYLHDSAGVEVQLDPLSFPNYDSLEAYCRVIEAERGEIDYERRERFDDLTHVTADFLIAHIDAAFRAWRERPWAKGYSWEIFREYVLPYRGSNEPLELWREPLYAMFDTLAASMKDSTDPIEAAALINSAIASWFKFDPRYYYHPTDQGYAEMVTSRLGRCEDMTNLTIYALRANGIPVTSDYTPHWATTGNNHVWNAIVLPDGRVVPFMGAEANPGDYSLAHKLAKAYRKTYSQQKTNLAFVPHMQTEVPRWLNGKNYIDVTDVYGPTTSETVVFDQQVPDSVDLAYLCVFNSGEWRPIDWAKVQRDGDKDIAFFRNVGSDVMLLPAFYLNQEVVPAAPPIVPNDRATQMFIANKDSLIEVSLSVTTKNSWVASTRGAETIPLEEGREYELFYWDNNWQSLGKAKAESGAARFDNVPSHGVYWLVGEGSDREERIFTLDPGNGDVVWR